MNSKCNHCGSVNKTAKWNESTERKFNGNLKSIEQGIDNFNYIYVCPSCNNDCFENDRIVISRAIISASGKPITDCSVIEFSR